MKKYALFEFEDSSVRVEVGPLEWVKEPIGSIHVNDAVTVAWLTNGSGKASATSTDCSAVLAIHGKIPRTYIA